MEDSFESARQGAVALGLKAIDAAKKTTDASFELFASLMGAKTMTDALELQTAFARKQMELAAGQAKEFQDAAQKAFMDAAKPTREAFEKAFTSPYKAA